MRRNLNIKQRKWRSFIFATIFGVTAATAVITVKPLESYAYTETAGVLNDGPVQMRKSPVNGEKITSLAAGTAVRVIDEADGSDGMKWYKVQISYNGMSSTGYIRSDFITLSSEDTSGAMPEVSYNSCPEILLILTMQHILHPSPLWCLPAIHPQKSVRLLTDRFRRSNLHNPHHSY